MGLTRVPAADDKVEAAAGRGAPTITLALGPQVSGGTAAFRALAWLTALRTVLSAMSFIDRLASASKLALSDWIAGAALDDGAAANPPREVVAAADWRPGAAGTA